MWHSRYDASTAFCRGRPLRAYSFECLPSRRVLQSLHRATFETVNSVCYPEQRRLVGDDEDRHRAAQLSDGRADCRLGGRVEGSGRLIEDEELRLVDQRPGDGQALALSPGKTRPT